APRANTTRPPGSLRAASGSLVAPPGGAPTDSHPDQLPLRVTCQRCQMLLSAPRAKTTRRPPVSSTAPGPPAAAPATAPPSDCHPDQLPSRAPCPTRHTSDPAPRANTTRPPGSLRAASGSLVAPPG